MSWLNALYETYEANLDCVGELETVRGNEFTLMPISHTTQTAQLEVTITESGDFHSVQVLNKISTLIPVSDSSASRSGSKIAPHPLHDKLNYVAGDLVNYGGGKKAQDQFDAYIKQLKEWAEADSENIPLQAIYQYLKKKELVKDLVARQILMLDGKGNVSEKWSEKQKKETGISPEVYSKVADKVSSVFVRFNVRNVEKGENFNPWNEVSFQKAFVDYYNQFLGEDDLCFVTGERLPFTERHAKKIRNPADNAKLISSNNDFGFTFKGRFKNSSDAAIISYEASQKAHNALKWLILRQAKPIKGRVLLFWGSKQIDVVSPTDDSFSIIFGKNETADEVKKSDTYQAYAGMIRKSFMGFKQDLAFENEINILILDAATPGRMNVQYYRNMNKEIYLENLQKWHETCVWLHSYHSGEDGKYVRYFGSPSIHDIAIAAYGSRANERLIGDTYEQLLPCILDNRRIPKPLIRSLVQRASNPQSMDNKWEWHKTISVACAVINREESQYNMTLNKETTNRSYLFGRLLALANEMEKWALRDMGEKSDKRETNAERYMVSFSNKPKRTWGTIYHNLQPYRARLGKKSERLNHLIIEVMDQFELDDFNDKPLDPVYLLGYSSQIIDNQKQIQEIMKKKENE
ncbi:type I-C CRISPR-associated protein Cas8c/Csd1 [Enterococcus alcedinis]|uniref:Type I-C CRISPR-associated protein Cas8c/Csd1 n=1 Tax=Enterococcus alcedinis TaxID=1274384 RepID=A0A917N5E1_9ENTE|nr:type I-C CRISPR-associated protein Cas8c/Csd1 [Enterococcus alcedinis]MBP2103226.1 CRISPR-associated protein Csd1 [Enterococcus alcedinis]GGI66783.1 type I-C CRISPR-associated protein Cas8c/Csd1 [Enterococcus alcedinis]